MKIELIGHTDMVFNDYKKTGLYIPIGTSCTFKCVKEMKKNNTYDPNFDCQNLHLANQKTIPYDTEDIIDEFRENPFLDSFIMSGLEPFDNFSDLLTLIHEIRKKYQNDIVIFTGYDKSEILQKIAVLQDYDNIIVKFGRFISNSSRCYDEVLGVTLISDNQYGERIS